MAEGIEVRHRKGCRAGDGKRCNCDPTYRASVWSDRDRKLIRKTFPRPAEAKNWRDDAKVALRHGTLRVATPQTVRQAADAWLDGARDGTIRTRSGDPYNPSAVRSYERALRLRVLPRFGDVRLSDLRLVDVQDFVDAMLNKGLNPSTIDVTLNPLRAIYRRAIARGELAVNPTRGLELPAIRGRRERFASPDEAAKLLNALPVEDRAVWATAMYAGLRRGELMALRWERLELGAGLMHVERGWDDREGEIETKGRNRRKVPIPGALRDYLIEHRHRASGEGRVFGQGEEPFDPRQLTQRADEAWGGRRA